MSTAICLQRRRSGFGTAAPILVLLLAPLSVNAAPRSLGCQVNQTDGVSLKTGQSMIENTTDKVIAQGTVVEMTVNIVPGIGKAKSVTSRIAAPSTLQRHDKMSGGDAPRSARSCTASISLVQPKDKITNKIPPVIAK